MVLATFCFAALGAPTMLGEDPATWSPPAATVVKKEHLLGEDPATYAPKKQHLFGEDPTTYAPKKQHLLGEDPATYAPKKQHLLGEDPATYTPVAAKGCDSISTKDACDKASCSWCASAAVPSSCKTIDEAKQLPSAVFQCDHL